MSAAAAEVELPFVFLGLLITFVWFRNTYRICEMTMKGTLLL